MIILAIDSSTPVCGIAILDKEKIWAESFLNMGNTHSEQLLPMIKDIFLKTNLKPDEIEGIAISKGPGSFTGLRIGMVTGKSLAQVLGKKIIAIPTLDILASNLWRQQGMICPILNARKNEVYTAFYEFEDLDLKRKTPYLALSPEELVQRVKEFGKPATFLGDGLPVFQDILAQELGSLALWAPNTHLLPRAAVLGYLALQAFLEGNEDNIYTLAPLYLRKSEAEVRLEERLCQRQIQNSTPE